MTAPILMHDTQIIARNKHYSFGVGRVSDGEDTRWLGYALGQERGQRILFVFPEVGDGASLGVRDRDEAIKRTGALVQDVEKGYGGVEQWLIEPALQGDPEEFRCLLCGEVCCTGCDDELEGFD